MAYAGYQGYTGPKLTPEQIASKREIADALLSRIFGRTPRNVGEGLGLIGAALASRGLRKKADKAEEAGRADAQRLYEEIFSPRSATPPAAAAEASPMVSSAPSGSRTALYDAVMAQESGGNPNAVSTKGATGLMQVMPETAANPGFGVEPLPADKLKDPQANRQFGENYLNAMLDRYGDTTKALAAYNWGPGNVDKWNGDMAALPEETRNYVTSIENSLPGPKQPATAPETPTGGDVRIAGLDTGAAVDLLDNPFLSPGVRAVLGAMLQQKMAPKRYSVGGSLVDASGNVIYRGKPDAPSALQQKIDTLVASGVDENTARAIATGRYTTSRDPITGVAQIVDKATGQVVGNPPQGQGGQPQPAVPSGASLYGQADTATGVVPAVKELSTDTLGQIPGVGGLFSFPDTVEARQNFNVATNDLIRSLSINPRFPVAEMQRIQREIAIEPSVFSSAEGMRARMRSVDRYLRGRLITEKQAAVNPDLPADQRQAAIQAAREIERFLGILGVPQGTEGPGQTNGQSGPRAFSPERYDSLPVVNDQAAYDQLPRGAYYRGADGAVRQKQ